MSPRAQELRARALLACVRARQDREALAQKHAKNQATKPAALCALAALKERISKDG